MTAWRSRKEIRQPSPTRKRKSDRKRIKRRTRRQRERSLKVENLEPRQLLAVSPQLVAINPNQGEVLMDGDIRNIAPTNLTFRFDDGQIIDESSLAAGIRITRAGFDGTFGDGNEVEIVPGFIGIGDQPNEVIARFDEALPDDHYRIEIFGATGTPLRVSTA